MMKQFYLCGLYQQYQLTIVGTHLQPKIVWSPLIVTWQVYCLLQLSSSHIVIRGNAAKILPVRKIRLPVRKILLLSVQH